ncbi:MAG: hypothetical protein L6R35_002167 [Caloplaca aegaea]|nr:MAG: hypothetical protein L6R35_002167 [Caloplaca aegaea]
MSDMVIKAAKENPWLLAKILFPIRNYIYECNVYCNCDMSCKNRNVLRGGRVELEILK